MHFMNPVPLMKLVEIVRGLRRATRRPAARARARARRSARRSPARDIPGFIVNRVLIPLLNEACYALYEGLGDAEDIDTAIKLGLNHPMGPLELADLIGLDTCLPSPRCCTDELGDASTARARSAPVRRRRLARPQDRPRLLQLRVATPPRPRRGR